MYLKLRTLKRALLAKKLFEEAELIEHIAKGSTLDSDPYNAIASPMDPLAWLNEECSHDFNDDPCPMCGKKVGE